MKGDVLFGQFIGRAKDSKGPQNNICSRVDPGGYSYFYIMDLIDLTERLILEHEAHRLLCAPTSDIQSW